MNKEEFLKIAFSKIEESGIKITEEKVEKLYEYKNLLLEWNDKINLTAIVDDYEIIIKHFVDCLECTKVIDDETNIIDVGTGAGFPGMVLAIYYPEKQFTLLDALNKRLIFLQEVVDKLNLKNVTIVHGRAEEVARKDEFKEVYDASVSRAVANLPVLLEYVSPFVKVDGKCIVMKGDNVEEEIKIAQNALNTLKLKVKSKVNYSYNVGDETYNRSILDIRKIANTPQKYPRNYGQIKKKPL